MSTATATVLNPVFEPAAAASLRTHFYAVAVCAPAARALAAGNIDLRLLTDGVMQRVRERAANMEMLDTVRLTSDAQTLSRQGIFFMQAPAQFADAIRAIDGVKSVEMPLKQRQPRRFCK